MNWLHAPLISPAVGIYCLMGVAAIGAIWRLWDRAWQPNHDPFAEPYGDQ